MADIRPIPENIQNTNTKNRNKQNVNKTNKQTNKPKSSFAAIIVHLHEYTCSRNRLDGENNYTSLHNTTGIPNDFCSPQAVLIGWKFNLEVLWYC